MKNIVLLLALLAVGFAGGCKTQEVNKDDSDSIIADRNLLASSEGDVTTFLGGHSVKRKIATGTDLIIIAEEHPNLLRRSYHLNRKVSSSGFMTHSWSGFSTYGSKDSVTPQLEQLATRLKMIDGVDVEFHVHSFDVSIDIGLAYNWDEVEPQVIEALKEVFSSK